MDEAVQPSVTPQAPPVISPQEAQQQSSYGSYGKRNWKKLILIYAVIAAVLYGGVYYFFLAKKTTNPYTTVTPTPKPESTSSAETKDWKTYTNQTYKYSLQIPNNWVIDFNNAKENEDRLVFIYSDNLKMVGDTQVPHLSQGSQLQILVKPASSYEDYISYAKPDKREYPNEGKEIVIDGEKAILWNSSNAYSIQGQKGYQLDTFHNGIGYGIYMVSALPQDLLFDQILSTFKFTQ